MRYQLKQIYCRPWTLSGLSLNLLESHYENNTRPKHFVSRQQDIADGIEWRDPEQLQQWIGELDKSEPVVVYCAYGFHIGCKTAIKLRDAGFDARYMNSGHSGWKAIGHTIRRYG